MAAPVITIVSVSGYKISDEPGKSRCTVVFKADQDIEEWAVKVGGNSPDTGVTAESGGAVAANTEITAYIDWNEGLVEGENEINIYARNSSNEWTPYHQD